MLYLVPSELPENKGGDIFIKSEYDTGFIELNLLPESWFMPTEEYQGWYVYCKGKPASNIQVFAVGGTEQTVRELISDYYDKTPEEAEKTMTEEFFDRFNRRIPPYLPRFTTLDNYDGKIEEQFEQWLKEEILKTSDTRASLHNQMKIEFNTSTNQVLDEIYEEFGASRDFYDYVTLPQLEDGSYWGFYVKIEDNFIPDWNISYDHAVIFVSWTEETGQVDVEGNPVLETKLSSPVPVNIKTNIRGIYTLHGEEMGRLYGNYPEYFMHYEEIEEEDRY